ncbi:hypothetical protein BD289DRAFT_223098 [Coniella lustricola]|uniref:Uncharacterized protein n=1 Tax=Coniella lustricola TaxID=2025994 RepID=A0A2T3AB74_9PEZI|nr:hypothetical protein BD289DRAFT_223098 [Coniella lustricola]
MLPDPLRRFAQHLDDQPYSRTHRTLSIARNGPTTASHPTCLPQTGSSSSPSGILLALLIAKKRHARRMRCSQEQDLGSGTLEGWLDAVAATGRDGKLAYKVLGLCRLMEITGMQRRGDCELSRPDGELCSLTRCRLVAAIG